MPLIVCSVRCGHNNLVNRSASSVRVRVGEELEDRHILMKCRSRDGKSRELLFHQPSNLKIDEGFFNGLSGMAIIDISGRQWSSAKIEVINFEQVPGITFLAMYLEILTMR